jgi:hypothetical protein
MSSFFLANNAFQFGFNQFKPFPIGPIGKLPTIGRSPNVCVDMSISLINALVEFAQNLPCLIDTSEPVTVTNKNDGTAIQNGSDSDRIQASLSSREGQS